MISPILMIIVVSLFGFVCGSRVVFPSDKAIAFETPPFAWAYPQEFDITGNIFIVNSSSSCDSYRSPFPNGIAIVNEFAGACSFLQMAIAAKEAGSIALMITSGRLTGVGRYQRVSQLGAINNFPVVGVEYNVTQYLVSLLNNNNTFVTVRLVPGINLYVILVYDTAWWWICSMIMLLMFVALFLFTLYKFVQVVLHRGWRLTVLHVLILLHGAAALVQIILWIDPYYSRGLYTYGGAVFLQWFPVIILGFVQLHSIIHFHFFLSLSCVVIFWFNLIGLFCVLFVCLVNAATLLSLYWLEALVTIGGAKVTPFLTKTKIPYFVFAGVSLLIAVLGSAFLGALLYDLYNYMAIASFALELGLALFFVIVGARTVHFAKSLEYETKHPAKRRQMEISIIGSAVLLFVYVLWAALAYYISTLSDNIYLPFVPKFFVALLAASVTVTQLIFVTTGAPQISDSSATTKSGTSGIDQELQSKTGTSSK